MARQLGLLNPAFAGSTISLDRRSNTSINAIDNVSFGDGKLDSTYNTLQWSNVNNMNPTPQRGRNALYDDVGPKTNSRTSQTTSKKPARAKQRRRDRIIHLVLMFLIIFVAVVALLLTLMLMMGKLGPKCSCSRTSGEYTLMFIGGIVNANSVHSFSLKKTASLIFSIGLVISR